jgi:acetyl esterase/lipase
VVQRDRLHGGDRDGRGGERGAAPDPVLNSAILRYNPAMMKALGTVLLIVMMSMAAAAQQEIVLRPDLPAGEEWYTPEENNVHVKSAAEKWVRAVRRPVLEVYPVKRPNGTAVVVAPGGGFNILAIEHEGRDVARWLNQRGVTAFVLRYRVGPQPDETKDTSRAVRLRAAVEDGIEAVKVVRARAAEWKIRPDRIGLIGFSAGGALTVGVATQAPAEARPDFVMPIYTGLAGAYTVSADAPPLFTAVAFDDSERMVETALGLARDWKKAGRPAELHLFADGGHGFGMNVKGKASDGWAGLLEAWLSRMGLLGGW